MILYNYKEGALLAAPLLYKKTEKFSAKIIE